MADRGERRHRTETTVAWRDRQVRRLAFAQWVPVSGKAKKKSHLDCGKPGCVVCCHKSRKPEPLRRVAIERAVVEMQHDERDAALQEMF